MTSRVRIDRNQAMKLINIRRNLDMMVAHLGTALHCLCRELEQWESKAGFRMTFRMWSPPNPEELREGNNHARTWPDGHTTSTTLSNGRHCTSYTIGGTTSTHCN